MEIRIKIRLRRVAPQVLLFECVGVDPDPPAHLIKERQGELMSGKATAEGR
jgi:hypothetical protein